MPRDTPKTGIVLSGGGARGAYEVGVIAGIMDVLEERRHQGPAFHVMCGTSVGAINAAYITSHAHEHRMGVDGLAAAWESLRLEEHLQLDVRGLLDMPRALLRGDANPDHAPSVLDTSALQKIVSETVAWTLLHENLEKGVVSALIIAALEIGTGRTTLFVETSPDTRFVPTRDPRRICRPTNIQIDHVMASAALPLLFPPRRIGHEHYADGGVRFNTPIAPAIRAGAERLIVVSLQHEETQADMEDHSEVVQDSYANPAFLLGKLLDALLLDPTRYDLHILSRLNDLIEQMEAALTPAQLETFHQAVQRGRDLPYRRLETLVFQPSIDLGAMAHEHSALVSRGSLSSRLLMRFATRGAAWESDLLSFMLFDGGYARRLIELGRTDVHQRAEEIAQFYGVD